MQTLVTEFSFKSFSKIPMYTRAALIGYVNERRPLGGFLQAVCCNNLLKSITQADDENLDALLDIVKWFYNESPGVCWGSEDKMMDWLHPKEGVD